MSTMSKTMTTIAKRQNYVINSAVTTIENNDTNAKAIFFKICHTNFVNGKN